MSRKGNRGKKEFARKLQYTPLERFTQDVKKKLTSTPEKKASWENLWDGLAEYGIDVEKMFDDCVEMSEKIEQSPKTASSVVAGIFITEHRLRILFVKDKFEGEEREYLEDAQEYLESLHEVFSLMLSD